MTKIKNTFTGKLATSMLLPALALGIFTAPAAAFAMPQHNEGVTTDIDVVNTNSAMVINAFNVEANTGDNRAEGGNGGDAGDTGDSGSGAGDGGNAVASGSDDSNDRYTRDYRNNDSDSAATAGNGGDTGNTGSSGNGGTGGDGGLIATGNAYTTLTIGNDINSNDTTVLVNNDCGCAQYDESFMYADSYYERNRESTESDSNDRSQTFRDDRHDDGSESSQSDQVIEEGHWVMYTKEFVPVTTRVDVENQNEAMVMNLGSVEANTGDNDVDGGNAGDAGDTGDSGSGAGDGGSILASSDSEDHHFTRDYSDRSSESRDGTATAGDGGDTGTSGSSGDGGTGGDGGVIVTGLADSFAAVVNVTNRNVTRVVR